MVPARERTLPKTNLAGWIDLLLRSGEVIAPAPVEGGEVMYLPVASGDDVVWEFENALAPPRQFVAPQTDPLFVISRDGDGHHVTPWPEARPRILLNLRSCDATGIEFMAGAARQDLPDDVFLRRLDATTVITLACTKPCASGFCICSGAGPFLRRGFDLQLTDLGDRLLAEPGSDKGEALLQQAGQLFAVATREDLELRVALEEAAKAGFGDQTCHFASAMRRVSTGRVPDALWQSMSEWCFECGGCTLVCPTCTCFSLKDQPCEEGWTRCQLRDSCQYAAFTLEASGHNPRPRRADRMKRRFFHKVSAQYYQRDGMVGCVGCGRCITVCLGTTDMPAVVAAIRQGVWHG